MLLESMSLSAWGPMGHDVVAAIAEQHLDRTDRKFRKRVMSGTYEEWFNDTVSHAAGIYDYAPLAEQQPLLGGYRLAYVLNTFFQESDHFYRRIF